MSTPAPDSEIAKAVVRRNTVEVQGQGRFDVFEELFADDFVDHTPQPGTTWHVALLPRPPAGGRHSQRVKAGGTD